MECPSLVGWIKNSLPCWFSTHFLRHAVSSQPIVLLLDGHSSHFTLKLVQTTAEHDVIIFCLPPHMTADSQPLDTSCFGPLKTYWSEACREFLFSNPGRVITKFQFSKLFSKAWSKSMSIENIVSGFRTTGIYPFNPEVVLKKLPSSSSNTAEPENGDSVDDACTNASSLLENVISHSVCRRCMGQYRPTQGRVLGTLSLSYVHCFCYKG